MDINKIQDFNYSYGTPQNIFFKYVIENFKFKTLPTLYNKYVRSNEIKTFEGKDTLHLFCDNDLRVMRIPLDVQVKKEYHAIFHPVEQNKEKNIFIIPVLVDHINCTKRKNDYSKHSFIMLYNQFTNQIQFFDFKAYHLSRFSYHVVRQFERKYAKALQAKNKDIHLSSYFDVPIQLLNKFKLNSQTLYPSFLLSYLTVISDNPTNSPKVVVKTLVDKWKFSDFQKCFQQYQHFYEKNQNFFSCGIRNFRNPETNRCVNPKSKVLKQLKIKNPIDMYTDGNYYDEYLKKYVPFPNIDKYEKILEMKNKNSVWMGSYLDNDAKIQDKMVKFIISKHKNSALMKHSIIWEKPEDEDTSKYELIIDEKFWKEFTSNLNKPRIKFIVIMLDMGCHSTNWCHSNNLIYSKETNEMERFDPHGITEEEFHPKELDNTLKQLFSHHISSKYFKYSSPIDFCPRKEIFQSNEMNQYYINYSDQVSNCFLWSIWYIDIKLTYPYIKTKHLIGFALSKLEDTTTLHTFIKNYHKFILSQIKKQ